MTVSSSICIHMVAFWVQVHQQVCTTSQPPHTISTPRTTQPSKLGHPQGVKGLPQTALPLFSPSRARTCFLAGKPRTVTWAYITCTTVTYRYAQHRVLKAVLPWLYQKTAFGGVSLFNMQPLHLYVANIVSGTACACDYTSAFLVPHSARVQALGVHSLGI